MSIKVVMAGWAISFCFAAKDDEAGLSWQGILCEEAMKMEFTD
ncbi:MAG: hypothetical protein ACKO0V_14165 [bacterium]